MIKFITVAIISEKLLPPSFYSDFEDDFFTHFGDKEFHLYTRIFDLESADTEYLQRDTTFILSVYDDDSMDLYRYITRNNLTDTETPITYGDKIEGLAARVVSKSLGVVRQSVNASWVPKKFLELEECSFNIKDLDPIPDNIENEFPGVYTPSRREGLPMGNKLKDL